MCVLTRLDTRYERISEDVFRLRAGHCVCVFRGLLFIILFAGALSSMSAPEPVVKKGSVLVFDMDANIQDSPVSFTQEQLINEALGNVGPQNYALRDILRALDNAADDMRIKALYLRGSLQSSNYGSGFAALKEVRKQSSTLRKFLGSPLSAHLVYPTDKDLYLVSTADKIILNPEGLIMNVGMASEPIFFAGFFKKYGIGVQVTKAGEFKSAAESFVMEKMSAPAREQTEALLEDLWDEYVEALSERAEMSPLSFRLWLIKRDYSLQKMRSRQESLTSWDLQIR